MKTSILGFLLGGIALSTVVPSQAETLKSLPESDFPIRIVEMKFAKGFYLSKSQSTSWGSWSVYFDTGLPTGEPASCNHTQRKCSDIRIKGFGCTNPLSGTVPCSMEVSFADAGADASCSVRLDTKTATVFDKSFDIKCPTDVKLLRQVQPVELTLPSK